MEGLTYVWNLTLVWPIENALLGLTSLSASAGIAIILFTVAVRTALLPLSLVQVRSQKAMVQLQPQLAELQKKHGGDRQRLGQETMRLYRENGANPMLGCLPLLLQMPIWIALYSALINLSSPEREIADFHAAFLWIPNLGLPPDLKLEDPTTWAGLTLPVLTAATQWVVQRMSTMPSTDPTQAQMQRTMEFMPLMFLFFSFQVAAGLTLYWVVSNIYSIAQQRFTMGWGTLPWLGSPVPTPADPKSPPGGATAPHPPPRRRKPTGGSIRRKRGK